MLDISWIFKLFREEIQLNLFRKLVDIKIFHIRRNIMPKCVTLYLIHSLRWHLSTREEKFHIYKQPCILFCLLFKHTNDNFLDRFPKISQHFPKIFEDSPKVVWKPDSSVSEHFPKITNNYQRFLKITEDFFDHIGTSFKFSLRDYVKIVMVIFSLL